MARRSFLRACGGSAALLAPLLRSIEARAQGVPAPLRFLVIRHAAGRRSSDLAAARHRDDDQLHAARRPARRSLRSSRRWSMIDGLNIVTASQQAGNAGARTRREGGMVAAHDRRADAGANRPAGSLRGRAFDRSDSARSVARAGGPASRSPAGRRSVRCSWPPTSVRPRRDRAARAFVSPATARSISVSARQPLYPGDPAARRLHPDLRRSAAPGQPGARCWRRS